MSQPKDPPSKATASKNTPAKNAQGSPPQPSGRVPPTVGSAPSPSGEKRSGRVGYDARGNSVWEWQLETGVYGRDVSTQRLKKLQSDELSLAETAVNKKPAIKDHAEAGRDAAPSRPSPKAPMPGGGFNPYDNSPVARGPSKRGK